ncbi:hypothetical protein [Streptomyces sp. enrichment culture]|uniref:hypothetical protein n=1 Tax=Streptomyces sp. enrichment culture TaxID=1795815 RepID=UPI003F544F47
MVMWRLSALSDGGVLQMIAQWVNWLPPRACFVDTDVDEVRPRLWPGEVWLSPLIAGRLQVWWCVACPAAWVGWSRMYACLYASVPPGTRCVADDAKALWRPSVVIEALRESPSAWVPSVATLIELFQSGH